MEIFSIEIWVVFQMVVDLILVVLILHLLRAMKSSMQIDVSKEAYEQVMGMVEPLLKEASITAKTFEGQLSEKNKLINRLNEKLDSRIISLNLLMNRAQSVSLSSDNKTNIDCDEHVYDQQEAILSLYEKGESTDTIARKLTMPIGEVNLVIDLKKKFAEMA